MDYSNYVIAAYSLSTLVLMALLVVVVLKYKRKDEK